MVDDRDEQLHAVLDEGLAEIRAAVARGEVTDEQAHAFENTFRERLGLPLLDPLAPPAVEPEPSPEPEPEVAAVEEIAAAAEPETDVEHTLAPEPVVEVAPEPEPTPEPTSEPIADLTEAPTAVEPAPTPEVEPEAAPEPPRPSWALPSVTNTPYAPPAAPAPTAPPVLPEAPEAPEVPEQIERVPDEPRPEPHTETYGRDGKTTEPKGEPTPKQRRTADQAADWALILRRRWAAVAAVAAVVIITILIVVLNSGGKDKVAFPSTPGAKTGAPAGGAAFVSAISVKASSIAHEVGDTVGKILTAGPNPDLKAAKTSVETLKADMAEFAKAVQKAPGSDSTLAQQLEQAITLLNGSFDQILTWTASPTEANKQKYAESLNTAVVAWNSAIQAIFSPPTPTVTPTVTPSASASAKA